MSSISMWLRYNLRLPASLADQMIGGAFPKRVTMDVSIPESRTRKDDWRLDRGGRKNQSLTAFAALQAQLNLFNVLFGDAKRGDHLVFDFLKDGSTWISFQQRGRADFGEEFSESVAEYMAGQQACR